MARRSKRSEQKADAPTSKVPWAWSIGLVLVIGLTPLVAAFLGELLGIIMGCEVAFPQLGSCTRGIAFFESLSIWLMAMIRWAIFTIPAALFTLVGLAISYSLLKKRGQNA